MARLRFQKSALHQMKMILLISLLLLSYVPRNCSSYGEAVVINSSGEEYSAVDSHDDNYARSVHETDPPASDSGTHDDSDSDHHDDGEFFYTEYIDVADFRYYPEEFEGDGRPENICGDPGVDSEDCIEDEQFILSDFVVAGTNLASYNVLHPTFQLYEDFNIGMFLRGDESWKDLLRIRRTIERPSLSWYVDKVARKRWLQQQGYPQPKVYWMKYKSEIVGSTKEEQAAEIIKNLPTNHGFCAKPTHLSLNMGNWLVDLDPNQPENTKFSRYAVQLNSDEPYDPQDCADSLAEGIQRKAAAVESWALKNVEPGIVIEELWSRHDQRDHPPYEFNIFVVWGRVYVGVLYDVTEYRDLEGFFYRDGSGAAGCPRPTSKQMPEWVPWDELVAIAESLGANKDMIRIDMFVGVPRYSAENVTLQIAISESELHPTTLFCNPFIADELARLWLAGYKIGNFEAVPNTEVPQEYLQT